MRFNPWKLGRLGIDKMQNELLIEVSPADFGGEKGQTRERTAIVEKGLNEESQEMEKGKGS